MGREQSGTAARCRTEPPEPPTQQHSQRKEQLHLLQQQRQERPQLMHVRCGSRRRLDWLLPLAVAAAVLSSAVLPYGCDAALPCERSGYCSLGKTKPFVGEVDSSEYGRIGVRMATSCGWLQWVAQR